MISTRTIARLGNPAFRLASQVPRRTLATPADNPLDKKVEMTNWEKVRARAVLYPS
jgi:hypothetical protein